MLQGWALMGENCPAGCPCPLVLKKSAGLYKCVQCDQDFSGSPLKPCADIRTPSVAPSKVSSPPAPVTARVVELLQKKLLADAERLAETSDADSTRKLLENMRSVTELVVLVQQLP